jgi:hypothetical protein
LDRTAGGKAIAEGTREPLDPRRSHLDRIFTFVLSIDDALTGESARELLRDFVLRHDSHLWPNIAFALNRYLVTYCCDDGFCPNPYHARGLSLVESEPSKLLLQFYVFLSQALITTTVAHMSSFAHLGRALELSASVIYSATNLEDEKPPYVSEWPKESMDESERDVPPQDHSRRPFPSVS